MALTLQMAGSSTDNFFQYHNVLSDQQAKSQDLVTPASTTSVESLGATTTTTSSNSSHPIPPTQPPPAIDRRLKPDRKPPSGPGAVDTLYSSSSNSSHPIPPTQ